MTQHDRKAAISAAKARAEALAAEHIQRGVAPAATEADRIYAECAALILEYATKDAELLPTDEANQRIAELSAGLWPSDEDLTTLAKKMTQGGMEPVREFIDHKLAVMDARRGLFSAWLDDHALKAWLSACDKLEALAKPGELVKPPASIQ